MPINIEGGLLVDGQEVGAGGLTSYTASVSFISDTDGLITYDVVPSDDEFLLSMTVDSNTAANTELAGSILNVVMHKSEITMTVEGETQTMLGYVGVLVVGDLSSKFDIFVTLPVGTATSGVIQMKNSEKKLYLHSMHMSYISASGSNQEYLNTYDLEIVNNSCNVLGLSTSPDEIDTAEKFNSAFPGSTAKTVVLQGFALRPKTTSKVIELDLVVKHPWYYAHEILFECEVFVTEYDETAGTRTNNAFRFLPRAGSIRDTVIQIF